MLRLRIAQFALWSGAACAASGCIYPRRATPLTTVAQAPIDRTTQPENLWQLHVIEAEVPRETRSGLSWDEDGGAPDVYFVLVVQDRERFRTEVVPDSFRPRFSGPSPNLSFDRRSRVRLELWDKDGVGADPIGIYEGRVLEEIGVDNAETVAMNGGAKVTLRLRRPEPRAGTGISEYELRPGGLMVRAVLPNSPAARAKLSDGDLIVAIDGKAISSEAPEAAHTAIALAWQRESALVVEREKRRRTVKLDGGYVWPAL